VVESPPGFRPIVANLSRKVAVKTSLLPACALLLVVLAVAAGCGGSGKKTAATTTAPAHKTFKIGLVTDIGGLNDRGFNHLAYLGLLEAKAKLGVKTTVSLSTSNAEYVPNLTSLARGGYDLVIGVGFTEAQAIDTAAHLFPHTKFAIVDVDQTTEPHKPPNLLGLLFREQQVGYLAGYLSGLEEKRLPGKDVVGSVGGQKQPPVDRFIAGFQAGAKAADPGVTTLNAYSQDFVRQDLCKTIALNQIGSGAGVVFQVAGGCGLGVIKAAGEKNVWAIGVDADQSYIDPAHVLTSATKHVDVAVFKAIESVVDGKFHGGNAVYGLEDDGVGLGKINPRVPKSEVAAVKKVQREIVSGKIANIPTVVK
jgi:basic membrane protein A